MMNSAAIVGGGIGGLATACFLVEHGWGVDVFERSDALSSTGTALGMWPEALTALDAIGVGDRVRAAGSPQRHGQLRRSDGSVLANVESHRGTTVLISRPVLLDALAEPLPDGVVKFSSSVQATADLAGYDVVIGADGVHSRVRDVVVGRRVEAELTGVSALIGWAPGSTDMLAETWGGRKIFGISPRDGDRTNWFAAYHEPVDAPMPVDPEAFLCKQFGHWHADVRDIVDRLDPSSILHYHVKQMPKLPSYVAGNVALIGDAAHAMAPNLGRGACETLIDAVTLGQALVESGVEDGLRRYDSARRKHTQRLVGRARMLSRLAMSGRFTGARDVAIKVATRFA